MAHMVSYGCYEDVLRLQKEVVDSTPYKPSGYAASWRFDVVISIMEEALFEEENEQHEKDIESEEF